MIGAQGYYGVSGRKHRRYDLNAYATKSILGEKL